MSTQRTILVTGATGKQGRSVIDALLAMSDPFNDTTIGLHILALARNVSSVPAQALAQMDKISVIQGDLDDIEGVFQRNKQPVWGLFSVQINSETEEAQGKALIDAAVKHGVRHFVYASGDRGGPERSETDPTTVRNFQMKFAIEHHLKEKSESAEPEMSYTILRPVTFFENQSQDRHGAGFNRMWMQMDNGNRKLQMISVRDIGWYAAQAFSKSASPRYHNVAISLAGDELTAKEAQAIFLDVTGKPIPLAPCIVMKGLKMWLSDTIGDMFHWFEHEGYGADVAACREVHPEMLDYRTWLREYSGFVKKA